MTKIAVSERGFLVGESHPKARLTDADTIGLVLVFSYSVQNVVRFD